MFGSSSVSDWSLKAAAAGPNSSSDGVIFSQRTPPIASPQIAAGIQLGKSHFLRAELRVLDGRQLHACGVAENCTCQSSAHTFLFVSNKIQQYIFSEDLSHFIPGQHK